MGAQIAQVVVEVFGGAVLLAFTRTLWLQERLRRQHRGDRAQIQRRLRGARLIGALVVVFGLFRAYVLFAAHRP